MAIHPEGADPYDHDFGQDAVSVPVFEVYRRFRDDFRSIIFSGRNEKFRRVSGLWLAFNEIYVDDFYMRDQYDQRPDEEVKYDFLMRETGGDLSQIFFIVDDRPKVVRTWRNLGIFVFEVNQRGLEF